MTLDVTKPTDQVLASELASYIREDREAINAVGGGTVTTVEEAFNVESAATVTTATSVNEATTVSEAVNVTNAAIVTNVDNIETNNGAITNVDVVASTPSVTAATTVTSATTVTAADNVTDASEVTTATNIENASAVQTGDVTNATTVTTGTTVTNATTVTDAIAVTNADNVETATTINSITTLTQATSCTIEHADVVNEFGGVTATASEINETCMLLPFIMNRAKFTYNGGTTAFTIKLSSAIYRAKDKVAYWLSELTTNAIGGTPSADDFYYLYLDYSAITSGTPITASELIWSTTAPTYNQSLDGWYNGDDLCIFAVCINAGATNIYEFFHDGNELVIFNDPLTEASAITPSATWTDVTCSHMPAFSTKALLEISCTYVTNANELYIRPNGSSGNGLIVGNVAAASTKSVVQATIATGTDQKVEVKYTLTSASNTVTIYQHGWGLPKGM